MKKTLKFLLIILFLINIISIELLSEVRVRFFIQNRQYFEYEMMFTADLMATVPDTNFLWEAGSQSIVLSYNASALELIGNDSVSLINIDEDFSQYKLIQSNYSPGLLSIEIFSPTDLIEKNGTFRIGTIQWFAFYSDGYDNLSFISEESVILNSTNKLNPNCNTPDCYLFINPEPGIINEFSIMPIVNLFYPENNITGMPLEISFLWNKVVTAQNYYFQLASNQDFTDIIFENSNVLDTSIVINELASLTDYFWRVRASNFNGYGEWSETRTFQTALDSTQVIYLEQGWNMISSFLNPYESQIPSITEQINNHLVIMKDGYGKFYSPLWNFNSIGNWNIQNGYYLNLTNEDSLLINGGILSTETTPLELNSGWNLISYIRTTPIPVQIALSGINSYMLGIKDGNGNVYIPSWGINTIGDMKPGNGYYCYMRAEAILTYPPNSAQKAVAGDNLTPLAKQLIPQFKNTGNNANLILELNEIENGNEVGVYNVNFELIGSGAVYNGVAAITIWGDDEITTEIDGALNNEMLTAKLLNSNNSLRNLSLYNLKEITGNNDLSNLTYQTDAIYIAKAIVPQENSLSFSINCIPNPTSSNTTFEFYLTDKSEAEIEVYTLTGELVANIPNSSYTTGMHKVSFETSNLANGVYNVVLSSGNQRAMTLMVVEK